MKGKSALEKNIEYSDKFIQEIKRLEVPSEIRGILESGKIKSLIDLGCGDGALIRAIRKEFPKIELTGVDISPRRISGLKKDLPEDDFHCADVCDTKIKKKFDFVHSSQVIEHVSSDLEMVKEMDRLLDNRGYLFVSSVIKKPFSIYKYRNSGKFVLDPTHEREYKNHREFLDLFKANFKLIKSWVIPVKRDIFGITVRIPGFYLVYGMWQKRK